MRLVDIKKELGDNVMPPMPSATTAQQVYQIFIRASPSQIWEAITSPDFTVEYFYGARVETTGQVNTPFRQYSPDGRELWIDEMVLESEYPHRLSTGWRPLYDPILAEEPTSRVTWEMEPQDEGYALLTVTHDRLQDAPLTAASVAGRGWMMVLSGLKSVLETGRGLASK